MRSGVLGVLLLCAAPASAEAPPLPVGGRPAAMGGAYSALAADAYAPAYNPGGLGFLPGAEGSLMHLSRPGAAEKSATVALPVAGRHGLGASYQYSRPAGGGGRAASYSLAYGLRAAPRLGVGAALKLSEAVSGGDSRRRALADLGAFYRFDEGLTAGAALDNVGSSPRLPGQAEAAPFTPRLGAAWGPVNDCTFAFEWLNRAGDGGVRAGAEWRAARVLYLRAGLDSLGAETASNKIAVSAGVGVEVKGQELSFAYVPQGRLGSMQVFSAVVRFGPRAEPKRFSTDKAVSRWRPLDEEPPEPAAEFRSDEEREPTYYMATPVN